MLKIKIPKSIRKKIRREKARVRREVFDLQRQKELIGKLRQELIGRFKLEK